MTDRSAIWPKEIWPKEVREALERLRLTSGGFPHEAMREAFRAYVHAEIRHVIRLDLGLPQPYSRHAEARAKE